MSSKRSVLRKEIVYPGPAIYSIADQVQNTKGTRNLISYQLKSINSSNAETEILVIQTVIKREEIKANIEKRLASHVAYCEKGVIDPETFSLIHQLQLATIDCLETIEKWRLQLTRSYPFYWKQKNYVQGMARDLDFVYFSSAMKKYLRRGSKKNPFLVPKMHVWA